MYYLASRYYAPAIGRFINEDSIVSTGQGILGSNMFVYCLNNSVCRREVSGNDSVEIKSEDLNHTDDDKDIHGGNVGTGGFGGYRVNQGNLSFKSEAALNEHYIKHNKEFGNAFSSPQEYVDNANYVIQNGEYVPNQNAYVKFYGIYGRANFAFVGLSHNHSYITTFHLKDVIQIQF